MIWDYPPLDINPVFSSLGETMRWDYPLLDTNLVFSSLGETIIIIIIIILLLLLLLLLSLLLLFHYVHIILLIWSSSWNSFYIKFSFYIRLNLGTPKLNLKRSIFLKGFQKKIILIFFFFCKGLIRGYLFVLKFLLEVPKFKACVCYFLPIYFFINW